MKTGGAYVKILGENPRSMDEVAEMFKFYFNQSYQSTVGVVDDLQKYGLVKVYYENGETWVKVIRLEVKDA